MSNPQNQFDSATLIRRLLFFLVLITLTLIHLLVLFRGLDSPQAMDQSQIGRQIARGEGFTTKFIRPLEHHLAERHAESTLPLTGLRDTYHSPLNPLVLGAVFKLVGADQPDTWNIEGQKLLYPLDRVVALVSTLFFLMSMGVTYLLVSRVFDGKIAGVTAVMMLLCNLLWGFSQSGLPQMLLLLLFTCGLYFTYRAVEAQEEGRNAMAEPIIAAVFFALMVLTHWITVWIFCGYLIFAAFAFRPRGVIALSAFAVLAIAVAYPLYRMASITGQPFGVARFVFYNGLAAGSEAAVMRTIDLSDAPFFLDGLLIKILGTTLIQATDLIPFLGGILAAPLFFIALLHPFKRPSIANFRWLILLMWVFAAVGMAIFGIDRNVANHPNQIHILFAPIMAAYGLAFLSILWSRLEVVATNPFLRNAHYYVIIALSAAPMLLSLPREVRIFLSITDRGGWPQWPPYYPRALNLSLADWVEKEGTQPDVVVSDQPWAVAWYADVPSVWLPRSMEDFTELDAKATDLGTRFSGVLITPTLREAGTSRDVQIQSGDFAPMVLDGRVASIFGPTREGRIFSVFEQSPAMEGLKQRFPYRIPMLGQEIIYYSEKLISEVPATN